MRLLAVALLLLSPLAGCLSEDPGDDAPAALPVEAPETIEERPVKFDVLSPLWVCAAAGCAGKSGNDFTLFGGATYVGFRLTVQPASDPLDMPMPSAQVRLVAECSGDHSTCPSGVLAETTGPWPATMEASGFRITDPDKLVFRAEYIGPYPAPVNGAGGDFDFSGTLSVVTGSEVSEEDAAEG
jgi:hypothetical protein